MSVVYSYRRSYTGFNLHFHFTILKTSYHFKNVFAPLFEESDRSLCSGLGAVFPKAKFDVLTRFVRFFF